MSLARHIRRFPHVEWDYTLLSMHPGVSLQTLVELSDKPWNWSILSRNQNFSWHWVRQFPEKPWNLRAISEYEFFTWDWIREFPDITWDWRTLSGKVPNIDAILEFPDKPWDWYTLTVGNSTTIRDILHHPNLPWTINELLFTEVDEDIVEFLRFYRSHYDKEAWLDHTVHTPWKLIRKNLDLPWNWGVVRIKNPDDFLDVDVYTLRGGHHTRHWDWIYLSSVLDFERIISKHLDLPWDFDAVSKNPTVKYTHVLNFPQLSWNYSLVSLQEERVRWRAAGVIKRYWKRCVTDPAFSLCRRLFLDDMGEISTAFEMQSEDQT